MRGCQSLPPHIDLPHFQVQRELGSLSEKNLDSWQSGIWFVLDGTVLVKNLSGGAPVDLLWISYEELLSEPEKNISRVAKFISWNRLPS